MDRPHRVVAGLRLRPEEEVLLSCIHADRSTRAGERLLEIVGSDALDWERLWALASLQEVQPLVARTLVTPPFAHHIPGAALGEAKTVQLSTLICNMANRAELTRIAHALHRRGVPVAPLKGAHLAERLFDGLDRRRVGDIDVLVREADLPEARATLRDLGYAATPGATQGLEEHGHHGVPYVRTIGPAAMTVELHWGLTNPRFVSIDYRHLWQRVLAASPDDVPLRPLPAEETLLSLAVHLPKHSSGLLRLLADIDRLVRREPPDWSLVAALAEQWNASALLYFALERARLFFDTPVEERAMRRLRPAGWRRGVVKFFVGPEFVLRPPIAPSLRRHRSLSGYSAMLSPARLAASAYLTYLFTRPERHERRQAEDRGLIALWSAFGLGERLARGVAWTGLVVASALKD